MSRRFTQVIKLKPGALQRYIELHANPPAAVLSTLARAHFTSYSISHDPLHSLLVGHFEYTGTDFAHDTALFAACPATRTWWKVTDSLQESLIPGATGSGEAGGWWLDLQEVFYFSGETTKS